MKVAIIMIIIEFDKLGIKFSSLLNIILSAIEFSPNLDGGGGDAGQLCFKFL